MAAACVVRFDESWRGGWAGLGDKTGQIKVMHHFAQSWGCGVIVPTPGQSLDTKHNDGQAVPPDVWWTRYYNFSAWPLFLRELPPGRIACGATRIGEPTPDGMRAWLAAPLGDGCGLKVLSIRIGSEFWSIYERAIKTTTAEGPHFDELVQASSTWEHASRSNQKIDLAKFNLLPSEKVLNTIARVSAQLPLVGSRHFVALHLRRGDSLGEEWSTCSSVPVVVANVVQLRLRSEQEARARIPGIFVATDEEDPAYLSRLRADLLVFFEPVVFETDIPGDLLIAGDTFFTYLITQMIASVAASSIEFHTDMRYQLDCAIRLERPFSPFSPPLPLPPPPSAPPSPPSAPPSPPSAPPSPLPWPPSKAPLQPPDFRPLPPAPRPSLPTPGGAEDIAPCVLLAANDSWQTIWGQFVLTFCLGVGTGLFCRPRALTNCAYRRCTCSQGYKLGPFEEVADGMQGPEVEDPQVGTREVFDDRARYEVEGLQLSLGEDGTPMRAHDSGPAASAERQTLSTGPLVPRAAALASAEDAAIPMPLPLMDQPQAATLVIPESQVVLLQEVKAGREDTNVYSL